MRPLPFAQGPFASSLFAAGLLAAGLTACASRASSAPAPEDPTAPHATAWDYVSARYDSNGDGGVERGEYDRGSFHRLDRNRDGRLDHTDFAAPEDPGDAMRAMGAELMVLWYFQDDDDPARLDRSELGRAFDAYDLGGDGFLDQEEFGCAAEERRRFGLPPKSDGLRELPAFELLGQVIDTDADGLIAAGELDAFFALRDDGDDLWLPGAGSATPPRRERGPTQEARTKPTVAVAAGGEPAPDFTLGRLDGDGEVTLSDFIDDRPVALIFGSYT